MRNGWTTKKLMNHPPKPMEACWMAALAAAIEIELALPLRTHDLSRLRLDHELRFVDIGRGKPAEIRIRVVANKNGRIVETVLHDEAAAILTEYIEKFRPIGPNPATEWLLPNRARTEIPRTKNGFSEAIADTVADHTGVRVNVQAFRAFAATWILEDNPHALEDVRALLGHGSCEIADRHYRRHNRAAAAERVSEGLARRLRQARGGLGGPHASGR